MRTWICVVLGMCALLVTSCSSSTRGGPESEIASDEAIGVATMEPDGTIVLWLRAFDPDTGSVGQGLLRFSSSDEDYQRVLDHLGGLEPGEEKLVPPFPEEWPGDEPDEGP